MIKESSTIHDPYTDDERLQLASQKTPLGGWGINPVFDIPLIIVGVVVGLGLGFGLFFYLRKNKR